MQLITKKQIMELYGVGSRRATEWLNEPSCPKMPRTKGQHYLVDKEEFEKWLQQKMTM